MRTAILAGAAMVAATMLAGCSAGRKSASGFHLPDGDVERGRIAFSELRCHACHEVRGERFPAPVAEPPVAVRLGGIVFDPRADGELTAAIVDPSHRLSGDQAPALVRAGSLSRMGDFADAMTVRQLIDLVAFLQSTYEVRPRPQPYGL
jgi:hypothetical protein